LYFVQMTRKLSGVFVRFLALQQQMLRSSICSAVLRVITCSQNTCSGHYTTTVPIPEQNNLLARSVCAWMQKG
jgi:hypothetical protein